MTVNVIAKKVLEGAIPKIGEMLVVGAFALGGKMVHDGFWSVMKPAKEEKRPDVQMYDLKEEA